MYLGAGGMLATKQELPPFPTRTNQIPRHIPPPHWASHPTVLFFAAGLLPFGTIFVELYFAMTSMWQVRITFGIELSCKSKCASDACSGESSQLQQHADHCHCTNSGAPIVRR